MIEDFFVVDVTIQKPTLVQDARGDSVRSWENPTEVAAACWAAPSSSGEPIGPGRTQVVTTERTLRFPAGTDIDADDRVVLEGLTWEVAGRPSPAYTPGDGVHHLRVQIKIAEG